MLVDDEILNIGKPLKVMSSAAGFYIGTSDIDGLPYSRESIEYWSTYEDAHLALKNGTWNQRDHY
jgi:hypothetical protein